MTEEGIQETEVRSQEEEGIQETEFRRQNSEVRSQN
jgi:hypothetical protein